MKSIMSLVKNKQKFKSSKSEYYKLNPKSSPTFSFSFVAQSVE